MVFFNSTAEISLSVDGNKVGKPEIVRVPATKKVQQPHGTGTQSQWHHIRTAQMTNRRLTPTTFLANSTYHMLQGEPDSS
jgi:hypothetical protein